MDYSGLSRHHSDHYYAQTARMAQPAEDGDGLELGMVFT